MQERRIRLMSKTVREKLRERQKKGGIGEGEEVNAKY
jgi:hypothetical protein